MAVGSLASAYRPVYQPKPSHLDLFHAIFIVNPLSTALVAPGCAAEPLGFHGDPMAAQLRPSASVGRMLELFSNATAETASVTSDAVEVSAQV